MKIKWMAAKLMRSGKLLAKLSSANGKAIRPLAPNENIGALASNCIALAHT